MPASHDNSATAILSRTRQVLFVSADSGLRAAASRILERAGYGVTAVSHSGHALLRCRTTDFDVLVADLNGPDVSGHILAEQVRRHCPGISTVYMSAPGASPHVDHLLLRPFTHDDLVERVHLALTGATP